MKSYFENIQWYDYLIFLLYNLILVYLIYRIGDAFLNITKKARIIFLVIFELYFFIVIADSFLNFMPYIADTQFYSYMISSGQYPQNSPENILPLYYASLFIGLVCLNSPVIFIFLNDAIYILALMLFLKSVGILYNKKDERLQTIFALLCLSWPAGMLFSTAPLRDAYILFAFAIFFLGLLKLMYLGKWKEFITGAVLLCLVRLKLMAFVLPVTVAAAVFKNKLNKRTQIIILLSLLVTILITAIIILKQYTPSQLAELRNINLQNAGELGYGYVNWNSYWDMLKDYPFLVLQFLLSPVPVFVQHNLLNTLFLLSDIVFLSAILLIILVKGKFMLKNYRHIIYSMLFYLLLCGTYEYNLSNAVRDRMPFELTCILFASIVLNKILPYNRKA